jgi:hypothetical protein
LAAVVSGNQGDRYSKRDREYARSMGRDPSDTFDAEILPGGKRRQLQLPPCDMCRNGEYPCWDKDDGEFECPKCHGTGIGGYKLKLQPCMWCDDMIEKAPYFYMNYWAHPDRYDVDDDGRKCADGEHDAEPREF